MVGVVVTDTSDKVPYFKDLDRESRKCWLLGVPGHGNARAC